uniref:Uncharacterized protein n=1 Tax=Anguilla anguilla TaxID=7936 RepID=A0A0E9ST48_ANGAN
MQLLNKTIQLFHLRRMSRGIILVLLRYDGLKDRWLYCHHCTFSHIFRDHALDN